MKAATVKAAYLKHLDGIAKGFAALRDEKVTAVKGVMVTA